MITTKERLRIVLLEDIQPEYVVQLQAMLRRHNGDSTIVTQVDFGDVPEGFTIVAFIPEGLTWQTLYHQLLTDGYVTYEEQVEFTNTII